MIAILPGPGAIGRMAAVLLSVPLLVIACSGVLLVWAVEIDAVLNPDLYEISGESGRVSLDDVVAAGRGDRTGPSFAILDRILIPSYQQDGRASGPYRLLYTDGTESFVDGSSGRLMGQRVTGEGIKEQLLRLHGLPAGLGAVGYPFIGAIFFAMTAFRLHRLFRALPSVGSLLFAALLLLCFPLGLTGLLLGAPSSGRTLLGMGGLEVTAEKRVSEPDWIEPLFGAAPSVSWEAALQAAYAAGGGAGDLTPRVISLDQDRGVYRVRMREQGWPGSPLASASDIVTVSAVMAQPLDIWSSRTSAGNSLAMIPFPLHGGGWLGIAGRIAVTLAGLSFILMLMRQLRRIYIDTLPTARSEIIYGSGPDLQSGREESGQ